MSQETVLKELKEGNRRFIEKRTKARSKAPAELAGGQKPHTIVLTCSDSRVPPELIFDQDLGELFVIRIAGNTASDEAVGSIEYAASMLGSQLCLVLGHSNCGAVAAAIDHHKTGNDLPSQSLKKVVAPIMASAREAANGPEASCLQHAVESNVRSALEDLFRKSPILSDLKKDGKLDLLGATYQLDTGEVKFML